MTLLELKVDLKRVAVALERVAGALERLAPSVVEPVETRPAGPEALSTIEQLRGEIEARKKARGEVVGMEDWRRWGPRRNYDGGDQ